MNRTQALRLWFGTLRLKEVQDGTDLRALWAEAGLEATDTGLLAAALQPPDPSVRRRELVRQTRRCIHRHGLDPDTLSTSAAEMLRGI